MGDEKWQSLPGMLFSQAAAFGQKPALWDKAPGSWTSHSWMEVAERAQSVARALRALGIIAGDRVVLVAGNGPEWVAVHFGIMTIGAISVPGYMTHTADDYRYVLADSGARAAIVTTPALFARMSEASRGVDSVETIVNLAASEKLAAADNGLRLLDRAAFFALGGPGTTDVLADMHPDDTACLIYTSGTGGTPKGVMLSHRNILSNCAGAEIVLEPIRTGTEIFLSFLPLNHAYEHMAGLMLPISIGAEIYFSTGAENLAGELVEVRPTIMTAVPRLFETLHRRILTTVQRGGGLSEKLFHAAYRLGVKRYNRPNEITLFDRLADAFYDRVVRSKVRARFGGRLKALVSGGGPLNSEIGLFFVALGVSVLQGYGQTETSPVAAVNLPGHARVDTVGPPMKGTELKIAEDGEILVRGPLVMRGYWKDPELTAKVIAADGWLHTGDVGEIDPDGQLRITDRKRDFIKSSGGEMIAPQRVEGFLTIQEGIAQAMIYGDRRPYLVALIVPDERLLSDAAIHAKITAALNAANQMLRPSERVRRFLLAAEPFAIDNGQLTPTLKIKRNAIRAVYGAQLEELYQRETVST